MTNSCFILSERAQRFLDTLRKARGLVSSSEQDHLREWMREDGTLRARRARVQMATETTLETKTQLAISKELRLIACTSFDHTLMKELGQFVVIVLDKLETKRVITETGHKPETTLVVLSRATLCFCQLLQLEKERTQCTCFWRRNFSFITLLQSFSWSKSTWKKFGKWWKINCTFCLIALVRSRSLSLTCSQRLKLEMQYFILNDVRVVFFRGKVDIHLCLSCGSVIFPSFLLLLLCSEVRWTGFQIFNSHDVNNLTLHLTLHTACKTTNASSYLRIKCALLLKETNNLTFVKAIKGERTVSSLFKS